MGQHVARLWRTSFPSERTKVALRDQDVMTSTSEIPGLIGAANISIEPIKRHVLTFELLRIALDNDDLRVTSSKFEIGP